MKLLSYRAHEPQEPGGEHTPEGQHSEPPCLQLGCLTKLLCSLNTAKRCVPLGYRYSKFSELGAAEK